MLQPITSTHYHCTLLYGHMVDKMVMIYIIFPCVQVNTNGHISFRSPFFSRIPTPFPSGFTPPLIAPYWEFFGSGNIYYRQTSNLTLLQRVHDQIQESFPSTGNFNPTNLFIATWDQVPGYLFGPNLVGICACIKIHKQALLEKSSSVN